MPYVLNRRKMIPLLSCMATAWTCIAIGNELNAEVTSAPDHLISSLRYYQPLQVSYSFREVRGTVPTTEYSATDLLAIDKEWIYTQDGKGNFLLQGEMSTGAGLEIFPGEATRFAIMGSPNTGFLFCFLDESGANLAAFALPVENQILAHTWTMFSYPKLAGLDMPSVIGNSLFLENYGVAPYQATLADVEPSGETVTRVWEFLPAGPTGTRISFELSNDQMLDWPFSFPSALHYSAAHLGFERRYESIQEMDVVNGMMFPVEGTFAVNRLENRKFVEHFFIHYEIFDILSLNEDKILEALKIPTMEGQVLYSHFPEDIDAGREHMPLPIFITTDIWGQMHSYRHGVMPSPLHESK